MRGGVNNDALLVLTEICVVLAAKNGWSNAQQNKAINDSLELRMPRDVLEAWWQNLIDAVPWVSFRAQRTDKGECPPEWAAYIMLFPIASQVCAMFLELSHARAQFVADYVELVLFCLFSPSQSSPNLYESYI